MAKIIVIKNKTSAKSIITTIIIKVIILINGLNSKLLTTNSEINIKILKLYSKYFIFDI